MNPGEIALLRTKLRELNIEYSALVRRKAEQLRLARLGERRVARQALMTLIAEARTRETREPLCVPAGLGSLNAAIQRAVEQRAVQHA